MPKEIKDFKKENAGRSMTEMLGVLAIIGVLSLGGIIGYKLAMNRYAANQIAYEINMMKTDAKVKIMQGNDHLTLGQPYDNHEIRFGGYGIDFGCSFIKDADDESVVVEEAETCQVANAYKIVLKNIPESICKPLANLINNMNDLIAFDINPKENGEAEEGGECEEGENVLNAVFSAEPGDLEVLKCEKKEDCPEDLYCHNHLCVECETHEHCQKKGNDYCADNTCHDCKDNQIFDATLGCVGCTEDKHCPNPTPICNQDKHVCMACSSPDECQTKNPAAGVCTQSGACCEAEGMIWRDGQCTCPDDYAVSETTQGTKTCLPYCKEDEGNGLIILIDQSGSISKMVTESGMSSRDKYYKAVSMLEEAFSKLEIPEEINAAVYLSGCTNELDGSGPCESRKKINRHLKWGKHRASDIKSAIKISEADIEISLGHASGLCLGIQELYTDACKTGNEKLIVIVYWDNDDGGTNRELNNLVAKCQNTQIYSVALNEKHYEGNNLINDFNLNNINDLNSGINETLNEIIHKEACIEKKL